MSSVIVAGDTSGSVTLQAPAVSGSTVLTLPAVSGTLISSGGAASFTDLTTTGNTILGDASTDTLNVGNGGLVKDASGNVGIGTASPSGRLDVGAVAGSVTSGDLIVTTGSTTASVTVGRLSSVGSDNTTFNVRNRIGTSLFYVDTAGVKTATTISVGAATPSTSGAGITFPATQSASTNANTLDDYEEGTWIPTLASLSNLSSLTNVICRYVKVGNLVICNGQLNAVSIAAGDYHFVLQGPFPMASLTNVGLLGSLANYPLAGTYKQIGYIIDNSGGNANDMYAEAYVSSAGSFGLSFQLSYITS